MRPLPFLLPVFKQGRPAWLIHVGLTLYDRFAGSDGLPGVRWLDRSEIAHHAPYMRSERVERDLRAAFLYADAQMLDDVIVRVAARAATRLGASYAEQTRVDDITPLGGGYRIRMTSANGVQEVTSRLVVNANLLRWNVLPRTVCLLNVGTHLVFSPEVLSAKPKDCAATLMQHEDGRVVFFIPWEDKWLLGRTERGLEGTPDRMDCPPADETYPMAFATQHPDLREPEHNVMEVFCGVRTIPLRQRAPDVGIRRVRSAWSQVPFDSPFYRRTFDGDASALSREAVTEESAPGLFTIYGGKFTTYRALSECVGDRIAPRLGCVTPCGCANIVKGDPSPSKSVRSVFAARAGNNRAPRRRRDRACRARRPACPGCRPPGYPPRAP